MRVEAMSQAMVMGEFDNTASMLRIQNLITLAEKIRVPVDYKVRFVVI